MGMVSATRPVCRCGHPQVWHRRPKQTTGIPPDDRWGVCEITGPQSEDGCACTEFVDASPKADGQ